MIFRNLYVTMFPKPVINKVIMVRRFSKSRMKVSRGEALKYRVTWGLFFLFYTLSVLLLLRLKFHFSIVDMTS